MRAQDIVRSLRGKWFGHYGIARCPAHDDKKPSLSISEDDGKILVKCHAGCSQDSVIHALKSQKLWDVLDELIYGSIERKIKPDNSNKDSFIRKLWMESINAENTPVQAYLRSRGISHIPPSLRCHTETLHTPTKQKYPAMIAVIMRWPDKEPHAIHRTYLDGDKKAAIEPNRMMLGSINGGAVMLGAVHEVMVVAEGIETALSVQQATGIPAWAVLSASNYRGLILPDSVKEITIAADNDDAGLKAAHEAAGLWARQDRQVRISLPPETGTDFNDLMRV